MRRRLSLRVDRQAPRHTDQPAPETVSIAQFRKAAMRPGKRFLGYVFRIFVMPQHAERDTKCEPRRLDEPCLEFAFELFVHGQEACGKPGGAFMYLRLLHPSKGN